MDLFKVVFRVCSPRDPSICREVIGWVSMDTTYSIIPADTLEDLGIAPEREDIFMLTKDIMIRRRLGNAIIKIKLTLNGEEVELSGATVVAFGTERDETILGMHALEALGLTIDQTNKKLKPTPLPL